MRRRWVTHTARWTLTTLTVVMLAAWPLSRWYIVTVIVPGTYAASANNGSLVLYAGPAQPPYPNIMKPGLYATRRAGDASETWNWRFLRFKFSKDIFLFIPFWSVIAAFVSVTTLVWLASRRAAGRGRSGACTSCGYPRAGLAPASPCPECGATPAA